MDKELMELLARRAGLEKALTQFPDDVAAAAVQADDIAGRTNAPTSPVAEPWPPMRVGASPLPCPPSPATVGNTATGGRQ